MMKLCVSVGFNPPLGPGVKADFGKAAPSCLWEAQAEENSQIVISGFPLISGIRSPIPAFLQAATSGL